MRILIAEDDPKLLKSLVHIFEMNHYAVDGVDNGTDALDFASSDEYDGLVLLGAYSTADLSGTELDVLSAYGTQDGVLNRDKYEECRRHYPQQFKEFVISGGNHAYFGDYGEQKGDGRAEILREEQICMTADAIAQMLE